MYQVKKLQNGLTVATATMPHMNSVSLGIWVGVGGRYEKPAENGTCHFIEHMLFKGTKKRSAREISQDVEGIGGYLNAFTTEEMTCYHARAQHSHFQDLLDVLGDMFLDSQFDKKELDKERGVIKEELAMYLDQPHQLVQEVLNETLWPGQALGRPLTGTPSTLDGMSRDSLMEYKRTHYVADRTIITFAGRIEHQHAVAAVSKIARRFSTSPAPSSPPADPKQDAPRLRLITKKTEQTQVALGIRACSRHDQRRFALRLLNTVLGENMSSRLFQVIREDRGLAYSIYSSLSYFDDVGTLNVSAGLDEDNLQKALGLIAKELSLLKKQLVSTSELKRAKDYVLGQMDLSLESTDNQMNWIGEQLLGYGKIIAPDEIRHAISRVKASEVRAVARDFFRPERINLSLVSPIKSGEGLLKLIALQD